MKRLTKAEIAEKSKRPIEELLVPEWGEGVGVLLREPTGAARDAIESETVSMKGKDRQVNLELFRAKAMAHCIVNEAGEREYSEKEVAQLAEMGAQAYSRIYERCRVLLGMSEADTETLTKN